MLLLLSAAPPVALADGNPRRALLTQLPPQSEIIIAAVAGSALVVTLVVCVILICCCFSPRKEATAGKNRCCIHSKVPPVNTPPSKPLFLVRFSRSDRSHTAFRFYLFSDKEGQGKSTQKIVSGPDDVAVPTLCFNDIQVATDGFSDDAIVGGAGHTTVYRGEGPSGEPWAVKRAKRVTVSGSHLFRNEVDFLSQIKHPNIVPLLYSCDDNSEQILVFEYLANGPLSVWLRPPPGDERAALTFEQRVDAALGVGEAVQYLHSFSRPTIIHRDIKSDTILLDDHLKVKLGGLGLLKHLPGEGMRLRVARKKGYLDPEYFQTFKVTPRCDVYSFGVVMLEMLTALPPIVQGLPRSSPTAADASFAGEAHSPTPPMSLPQWALPLIQEDRVEELVDPRMPPGYPRDSLVAFARIAAECVAPLRKDRPDMPRVTFLLAELKRPAALRSVAFARFYTGDHKAQSSHLDCLLSLLGCYLPPTPPLLPLSTPTRSSVLIIHCWDFPS
ncbi:unnamed protein product [Closterium sp. NIES-64]|nr:unnamed protein product [Closterium sp. NIES-64]